MEKFPDHILEQILVRLDVEDLLRCKGVCKSWQTFISHPRFIKTHLNHSYNDDRNNNKHGHRRVIMYMRPLGFTFMDEYGPFCYLIGSSNGLVCICYSNAEIVVANPCTRVERKLPQIPGYTKSSYWPLCCGFGYDSRTDDYKVVAGLRKDKYVTCFLMLTLKSNVWEVVINGEVEYMFSSRVGVLCNGALHWVMFPQNNNTKAVILSFDLSHHCFKEIPQPDDDPLYQSVGMGVAQMRWRGRTHMSLGIMTECLCIFRLDFDPDHNKIWIMNKYSVKESWGIVGPHDCDTERQPQHTLPDFEHAAGRREELFVHYMEMCRNCYYIGTPVFVRSLVSPHAPFFQ